MENGKASGDEEIGKQSKEEKKMFSLGKEIPTWVYEKLKIKKQFSLYIYWMILLIPMIHKQTLNSL